MEFEYNELGQPVGQPVPGWSPRPAPPRTAMSGRFCTVMPLDPERHAAQLFAAYAEDREGRMWTYLPWGPFAALDDYRRWADEAARREDPFFHAIIDNASGQAGGAAPLFRGGPPRGGVGGGGPAPRPRRARPAGR